MYAKARAGLHKEFTGISDPTRPGLGGRSHRHHGGEPEEAGQQILLHLERQGFIAASSSD